MKRRDFIKSSVIVGSASGLLLSCDNSRNQLPEKNHISGFIISDAHIGMREAQQPSIEEQSRAIQTIKNRFPNLDVVFDTGDIHHGYLNEKERNEARNHWLSKMANQFPRSLFHYIVGNHELGKGPFDTEITATKIGSMNFRPYYSFDYKGVHFVSLPQLTDTILINKESIRWLEHDLLMNRDKTTLIFSHNSIAGTTFNNGETSYRVIINSDELLEIINSHPSVLGWFHGHNHQYEVKNLDDRLYVSNGRIGGFNPPTSWGPFGQGHLGGVYFEINKNGLLVRCFSATKNKFLDEVGYSNLTNSLKQKTSFDPYSECNYYFGHGQLSDNVEYELKNHYLSAHSNQLFHKSYNQRIINDNDDFGFTTELFFAGGRKVNRLIGYQLLPGSTERKSVDNGLLISRLENQNDINFKFPKHHFTKQNFMVRGSYFRCESGDSFHVESEILGKTANSAFEIQFLIYDENQNKLYESKYQQVQDEKPGLYKVDLLVPNIPEEKASGNNKYIKFSVKLKAFPSKFIISKMALSKKIKQHKPTSISINSKQYNFAEMQGTTLERSADINTMRYQGETSSVVIKVPKVLWQIRNAIAYYSENTLKVTEYAHNFQKIKEVIITPTTRMKYYVNKVINIMPFDINYKNKEIRINVANFNNKSLISLRSNQKPVSLLGAELLKTTNDELLLKPTSRQLLIKFS
ncbi:metallophosphoesterase family protein [Marinicella gelatinilytica]|uniref:metallophosphoesterase family protein n=1 Tax=Marinicella gelatinilytica TaxID=2996017 RepID=UPI002260B4CD|nr:hypothetical protein [Marinicella gelatinilytica]MCX7545262.1 hypothetical protein [Marinicella gelatinilytica]